MVKQEIMDKKKTNEKIGDWLMDVAKYILTAGIISSFLGDLDQRLFYYGIGLMTVCVCFFGGLFIINKK
jgi:hypothetical protein